MSKPFIYAEPFGRPRRVTGLFKQFIKFMKQHAMEIYTFLTCPGTEPFCHKESEKLNKGWELYGNTPLTFNGINLIAGQAPY